MSQVGNIERNYIVPSTYEKHYVKFLVTIALRLGIEIKEPDNINLDFNGRFFEHNTSLRNGIGPGKNDSYNYLGSLTINGHAIDTTEVLICTPRENQNHIITLWPIFTDDKRSQITNNTKTQDFIKEYLSSRLNLTIHDLAKYYNPLFTKNPDRTPLDMSFEVSRMKSEELTKQGDLHQEEIDALIAKEALARKEINKREKEFKEREKEREKEFKKREKEREKDYQKNLNQVIKENQASEGSPNQETKKSNSDVDWSSSSINSAVFNYFEVKGDYLCIYINDQIAPIRLKNTSWATKYPAALKNAQKLKKGDIFKYITQGVNTFSPEEWFNRIILEESDSKEIEDSSTFDDIDIEGTSYILTSQIISDLNNTQYTFNKTFNVINTYLIPGEEFRKHYGFPWSRPMTLIETDLGWYIDSASNSNGDTKWTPGEHQNCRISLTKGKHLPYWLEK